MRCFIWPPKTARRACEDGADEEIPPSDAKAGDKLRVRPGHAIPVDGEILDGKCALRLKGGETESHQLLRVCFAAEGLCADFVALRLSSSDA